MFYGILDLPWWGMVLYTVIFTQLTILAITIYLHRAQAHRAVHLHPVVAHVFRLWLFLSTGAETKAWVSIHRKHHARCETPEDPHSPVVEGISTVMWQGAELYRKESCNTETLERFGQGTPNDWIETNLYTPHSGKGIYAMMLINVMLIGVPGITVWALQMAWMPFFAAGIINGVGHYWGYRNFECSDASRNIIPWGVIIGGEELHNNHHAYPSSARFSIKPWEFDMGWGVIRLLQFFKLAEPKRVAPKVQIAEGKKIIDGETLKALLSNRVHVMAQYSKAVIKPVFKQEQKLAKDTSLFKRAKQAFFKHQLLLDSTATKWRAQIIEKHRQLAIVYDQRERLQAIWDKTAASQKELIDALHAWCKEAESTGVAALQDFSAYLKNYALKPVKLNG